MRRTSVRELHIRTSELVREAAQGEVIVVERRGEPVAELRPFRREPAMSAAKKAKIFAEMEPLWAAMGELDDRSTGYISEDRDR
jgi:prevent-host-death family protein